MGGSSWNSPGDKLGERKVGENFSLSCPRMEDAPKQTMVAKSCISKARNRFLTKLYTGSSIMGPFRYRKTKTCFVA